MRGKCPVKEAGAENARSVNLRSSAGALVELANSLTDRVDGVVGRLYSAPRASNSIIQPRSAPAMATFPPPPPIDPGSSDAQNDDNFAQFEGGPPPWSGSAITGFVSSLLICIPVVSSLVGLIAGIMGISSTAGGRRRGRGLAIAAIPISLLTGVGWAYGLMIMVKSATSLMEMKTTVEQVFKARDLSDEDVQALIESSMSERAAASTTPAKIREWVEKVKADQGSLAEVTLNMRVEPMPGTTTTVLVFPCRFVNGTADVRVISAVSLKDGMKFLIDDIKVGGHSLHNEP
jgi:hypothetical protein